MQGYQSFGQVVRGQKCEWNEGERKEWVGERWGMEISSRGREVYTNLNLRTGSDINELTKGRDSGRLRRCKNMNNFLNPAYKVNSDFGRQGRTDYYKCQMLIWMKSEKRRA